MGEWAGQWASRQGKGGEQGERGERQQFLFSVHHHPNFHDFSLRAIAPFTGSLIEKLCLYETVAQK